MRALMLLLALALTGFAQDTARMEAVLKEHTADDKVMGSFLVAKNDQILFERSSGWANAEWKIPNSANTRFRIGSVTKQFTAAAILLLEEQGRLSVEDPVSKWIPNAPKAWHSVTLRQLLNHTGGVPSFTDHPEYRRWKVLPETPDELMHKLADAPLDFAPGEKYKYSNTGYLVLGWIVERASEKTYTEFLQQHLFAPLGMKDTGYDLNSTVLPNRASGYVSTANGLANAPFIDMRVPGGAGALYSTTHDLHRWNQGLFGGKLLKPESLAKMTTPAKRNYAFGLTVKTQQGRKVITHGGGIEGFNSHLAYYPESKLTVVVLCNVNTSLMVQLSDRLAAVALGDAVKLAAERQATEVPVSTLQRYVGVYRLTPKITNTVRLRDGQLTTQLSGQAELPLFAESATIFFLKVVDAQMEFVTDGGGDVIHAFMYQNGRKQMAERISDKVVERKEIAVPVTTLEKYVGTYQLRPGFDLVITLHDGQLISQATGQAALPLFAESETKFFLKAVDAQIEFGSENGTVTHLVLHQGPFVGKAPKKGVRE